MSTMQATSKMPDNHLVKGPDNNLVSDSNYYVLGRGKDETTRLNEQHHIVTAQYGFLLSPAIPLPSSPTLLRIADFATGTGIFCIELAKAMPYVRIDGYDISDDQFPQPDELPRNVMLKEHDILKPLGKEYSAVYDVVCVRFLALPLKGADWERAVQNLLQVLKPGGYLQWIDADLSRRTFKVYQSVPGAPSTNLTRGLELMHAVADLRGATYDDVLRLPNICRNAGMERVVVEVYGSDNKAEYREALTEEVSRACYAQICTACEKGDLEVEEQERRGLLEGMRGEAKGGRVYLKFDSWVVVARKAMV